ncbi:ATP-dependent DNA helicase UvrD2 [Rhabdothermincola sp.]|uniref:ATP-dependent DNA helicase UvrD2 n=1 Tax=Rhabdothermincola sp. TaxID=2820405 RepID=UPI002FE3FC02
MDARDLLDGLNDSQRRAVTSPAQPLCVLAGAGSGKTRVLTRRIAWRAATGDLDPRHVLALTFTRKAAGELTQRLRQLGLRETVAAGTFHAVAFGQLRQRWADRGVRPPELLDRKVPFVARLLPAGATGSTAALDTVSEIEWAKARLVEPAGYVGAVRAAGRRPSVDPTVVAEAYDRYEQEKRRQRLVDFDDLLGLCRRDLQRDEEFARAQRWRFRHLFVDEFQDVNPLQHALLDAWCGERADLCVVGDPNQAIYGWNGADPALLDSFADRHPGTEVVRLADNYRSTPQILAVANALLPARGQGGALRAHRPDGPVPALRSFPHERAEAAAIARAVRDHHRPGARWASQAVLVRTNGQIALLEEAFRAARVPFRVRGDGSLLDQPDVKARLRELRQTARELPAVVADLEAAAAELRAADDDASAERAGNLEALVQLARDYAALDPAGSVEGFLAWLRTTTRSDQPDAGGDAVEIATFHAAKGLEWPIVHIAGLEQGLVPIAHARTPAALAEERRLLYVAVTRAEQQLLCSWAKQRTYGERTVPREPSPYLEAITAACERLRNGPSRVHPTTRSPTGRDRSGARPRTTTSRADLDEPEVELLDVLKAWRAAQAKAAAVPAYVIFHDRTLEALAAARPRTHTELLALPGMGPVKVSRWGDELLEIMSRATR